MKHRPVDVSKVQPISPVDQGAPMLEWLPIDRLVIDDRYQRPLDRANWAAIKTIAENFHWSRFTPVLVAPIEDGLFAIIDGQHRSHAAAICGFKSVPAMAVHMTRAEQASAFSWVNGTVVRLNIFHRFKAALAAGEDWAVRCDAACSDAGCKLMTFHNGASRRSAGEIYTIQTVREFIKGGHDAALKAGLAAIRTYDVAGIADLYSDGMIKPFVGALVLHPEFVGLDLVAFLRANNPLKLMRATARMREQPEYAATPLMMLRRNSFVALMRAFRAGAV